MHFLFNFAQTRPWEGTHKENGSENSSLYKYIAFSWEILQYFFLKKELLRSSDIMRQTLTPSKKQFFLFSCLLMERMQSILFYSPKNLR